MLKKYFDWGVLMAVPTKEESFAFVASCYSLILVVQIQQQGQRPLNYTF
jgi:hypothetical protein